MLEVVGTSSMQVPSDVSVQVDPYTTTATRPLAPYESWTESELPTITAYWIERTLTQPDGERYTTWREEVYTFVITQPVTGWTGAGGSSEIGPTAEATGDGKDLSWVQSSGATGKSALHKAVKGCYRLQQYWLYPSLNLVGLAIVLMWL